MKTFGKLYRGYEKATHKPIWAMELEPHVALRAKRVFPSIDKAAQGRLIVFETLEVCREIEWFMERFPLEVSDADRAALEKRAGEHRDRESLVESMIQGLHKPRAFKLALEPRDYQRSAADLALTTRGLLLADDVGLGKTCSSICVLSDPKTRPALVVTMTHLTRQWKRELGKFAPALNVHVLKTTTPYHLGEMKNGQRSLPGMFPDVIIGTYSKLAGWAGTLAPLLKSVIWDEVQELRTGEGTPNHPIAKGVAAAFIADAVEYRMGLSATPIYNYGCEIWTVLRYCAPGALGSWKEFLTEWGGESDGRGKSKLKQPKAFGTYARAAGFMLRRTRAEVGRELPEVVRVPHEIECDTKPLEEITSAAEKLARIILAKHEEQRGDKRDASSKLDLIVRRATGVAKAPYVAEFVRLLVESGEQVVLYGWHRDVYAIWNERLAAAGVATTMYTGTESPQQKDHARATFLSGDARVLIMSLRSGAGLDGLQDVARTVVFGELDWSPGVHEQCIGRVHRDGQASGVVAYFLVCDEGSDVVMRDVLQIKRAQAEGVRNPTQDLIEKLDVSGDRIRELARVYLDRPRAPSGAAVHSLSEARARAREGATP